MKMRSVLLLMAVVLLLGLAGCGRISAAEDRLEERMDAVKDSVERAMDGAVQTGAVTQPAGRITREQAQTIALEHAGFSEDQVTRLRTEYEMDDGVPRFEVTFRQDRWEYDYEINADTGEILAWDRDDG